ncbi:MAG: hypothetical protein AAFY85_06740, partial [Pseudomonadota bacterium]
MSKLTKTLLGAAGAVALLAPAAFAQDACDECTAPELRSRIVIDQIHVDEVWSTMDVELAGGADVASSAATTVGNTANGLLATGNL